MSVPVPAELPVTFAGGDLQGGEQRGGAIPDVVMGALLRHARACIGSVFWVRSNAWILDFSSTHNTIAFSGGARYSPMMSDHLGDQARDRWRARTSPPATASGRMTATPSTPWRGTASAGSPSSRDDQSVTPNRAGGGRNVSAMIFRWSTVSGPAWPIHIDQPGHASIDIAGPPHIHRRPRYPDPIGDLGVAEPFGSQQHDPSPLRQPGPHRGGPHQPGQLLVITNTQQQRRSGRMSHTPIIPPNVKLLRHHAPSQCRVSDVP